MAGQTELTQRFFDKVCNGRRLEVADELFAAGHVYHDPGSPGITAGPAGMKELIGAYQRGFQDASWTIDEMLVAGDAVMTRWTGRGTHTGELMGLAPTGRRVAVSGIWIQRIANGRIAESWNAWDTLGMLQQLGAGTPRAVSA